MRNPITRFLAIAVFTVTPLFIAGGEMTAEQIVDRYTEAIGGKSKVEAVTTLKKSGAYVYNGLEYNFVQYYKRPNHYLVEIEGITPYGAGVAPGKYHRQGFDGKVPWSQWETGRNPEPQAVPMDRAARLLDSADFDDSLLTYKEKGAKLELVGQEDVDGTNTHHLKLTLENGNVHDWYLDVKTYLPVQRYHNIAVEEGQFYTERFYYRDYRPVAGVKMAHEIEVEENLFTRIYYIKKIEANVDLKADMFTMPAKPAEGEAGE